MELQVQCLDRDILLEVEVELLIHQIQLPMQEDQVVVELVEIQVLRNLIDLEL